MEYKALIGRRVSKGDAIGIVHMITGGTMSEVVVIVETGGNLLEPWPIDEIILCD